MFPERIFPTIPATYPIIIKVRNNTLFPFAVPERRDLTMFTGQDTPKQITMIASKISVINLLLFIFYIVTQTDGKHKKKIVFLSNNIDEK